ncbi:hypothetical protein ACLOJK_026847 [Asimina triloba]
MIKSDPGCCRSMRIARSIAALLWLPDGLPDTRLVGSFAAGDGFGENRASPIIWCWSLEIEERTAVMEIAGSWVAVGDARMVLFDGKLLPEDVIVRLPLIRGESND